jgi:hypothetical protein
LESLEISIGLVWDAIFPASEEDPDPFKSDRPHCGMMTLPRAGWIGNRLRPTSSNGWSNGELVKALAEEFWAGVAEVNAGVFTGLFTAGSARRCGATQGRKFAGMLEALPIGAKGA